MKPFEIERIELYAIIEHLAVALKVEIDSLVECLLPVKQSWGYCQPTQELLNIGEQKIKEKLERLLLLAREHQIWRKEEAA
jgi:hypothetical protein